jgi:hypothetical protein
LLTFRLLERIAHRKIHGASRAQSERTHELRGLLERESVF